MTNNDSWEEAIIQRVCERLFSLVGADLEEAYRQFDSDKSGIVDYSEFVKTLKSLDVGLTDQQIYELMRSVDVDDNACIDFNEFAERFRLPFQQVAESKVIPTLKRQGSNKNSIIRASNLTQADFKPVQNLEPLFALKNVFTNRPPSPKKNKLEWDKLDKWTLECLRTISKKFYKVDKTLPVAFSKFDQKNNAAIDSSEFFKTLNDTYSLDFTREDSDKLFQAVDANDSGKINYMEFVEAFQITDTSLASNTWKTGLIQQVSNMLYQNRIHLRHAFRMFDTLGNGTITTEQFQSGMYKLNDMLEQPLSLTQIEELRRALDKDGNGSIDYKEFFDGFSISDTEEMKPALIKKSSSQKLHLRNKNQFLSKEESFILEKTKIKMDIDTN